MPIKSITPANHFDLSTLADGVSLEAYIKAIQQKPVSERTGIENRILDLYTKANEQGTKFCIAQIRDEIKNQYRQKPLLFLIGAAVVAYILFKAFK